MTTSTNRRAPAPQTIKLQKAAGYITPAAAVDLIKKKTGREVSLWTAWRWARKWAPTKAKPFGESLAGKFKAYRDGGNRWLLVAAVEEKIAEMTGRRP